jgi:drug/metabolite transporter (DMT)-like permease
VLAAVLALGASVAWGIADFLGGIKSRVVPLLVVLLLAQPVGFVGIGVLVAIAGNAPPGRSVLWAIPAALLGTIGIAAFYRGMAVGSISIIAPIVAVAAVVPVAFGVATGDDVSSAQWLGFVLALGGVALASLELDAAAGGTRVATGVGWAVAAIIGFGGYYVPMHEASEQDFLWATWIFRGSVALLVLAAWLLPRPPLSAARGSIGAIMVIGILDSAGNALFAAAASEGAVSIVSVLATLYPVTTVALAAIVLGERVQRVQRLGVLAALAGVALISAG